MAGLEINPMHEPVNAYSGLQYLLQHDPMRGRCMPKVPRLERQCVQHPILDFVISAGCHIHLGYWYALYTKRNFTVCHEINDLRYKA